MVPWMSVSKEADKFDTMSGGEVIALFGIGIAIPFCISRHDIFNITASLSTCRAQGCCNTGSQKTLPVALSVISFLPLALSSHGLMSLPCIITFLPNCYGWCCCS